MYTTIPGYVYAAYVAVRTNNLEGSSVLATCLNKVQTYVLQYLFKKGRAVNIFYICAREYDGKGRVVLLHIHKSR